jgi:long-subunit acyl-CoA synthetase (AMP-forming)/pyrroloquinoline quinone (PQQ) biosynthesis protein C
MMPLNAVSSISTLSVTQGTSPSQVMDKIRFWSEQAPTRIALRGIDALSEEKTLTYKALQYLVDLWAGYLRDQKVQRAALLADNDFDWVVFDLACMAAQVTFIPIPCFFTEQQRKHAVNDANVDVVVTCLSGIRLEKAHWEWRRRGEQQAQAYDDAAKITYTSGSTGNPKGIVLSQSLLDAVVLSISERLSQFNQGASQSLVKQPRHLCTLPLSTLLENVTGVYVALINGGEVITLPMAEIGILGSSGMNQALWLQQLEKWQPKSMIITPEMLKLLVSAAQAGRIALDSFQFIAVGGGKVSKDLMLAARHLGIAVYQGYGLSEAGSVVSLQSADGEAPDSVGKPLSHLNVTIASDGEILVASRSKPNQLLHTGDLGFMSSDGQLFVNGRKKNQIISSFGRNISPEWIESQIVTCPLIHQAIVVGEARPYLAVLLVPVNHQAATLETIEQHISVMNQNLPDYAQIRFSMVLDQPFNSDQDTLTSNGRLKRPNILEKYQSLISNTYQEFSMSMSESSLATSGTNPSTAMSHSDITDKDLQAHEKPQNLASQTHQNSGFYQRLKAETQAEQDRLIANPMFMAVLQDQIIIEDYQAFLAQAYHHVKHTVPLLMACGGRLPESYEWLREAIAEYIEEELGHQEWVLNDIAACGGDKEAVRTSAPSAATELMVAYAYDSIHRNNPLAFFGMVHVLEGTSVSVATPLAERVQKLLGLPNKAFSYLLSHGSLDLEHVDFFESLMNRITDPKDQEIIIHSAKMFYELYGNIFRSLASEKVHRDLIPHNASSREESGSEASSCTSADQEVNHAA